MIAEDYVSFETAELLKEKGFNEYCKSAYHVGSVCSVASLGYRSNEGYGEVIDEKQNSDFGKYDNAISAPTLQMTMKWLRKKFNLNPVPYALSLGWAFDIFDLSDRDITGCKKIYSMDFPTKNACYETYEEAAEAAIKYVLSNLI